MLTVSHDSVVVELDLLVGRVACPDCGGRLRPWGWARPPNDAPLSRTSIRPSTAKSHEMLSASLPTPTIRKSSMMSTSIRQPRVTALLRVFCISINVLGFTYLSLRVLANLLMNADYNTKSVATRRCHTCSSRRAGAMGATWVCEILGCRGRSSVSPRPTSSSCSFSPSRRPV